MQHYKSNCCAETKFRYIILTILSILVITFIFLNITEPEEYDISFFDILFFIGSVILLITLGIIIMLFLPKEITNLIQKNTKNFLIKIIDKNELKAVIAFVSIVLASTLFELFKDHKIQMFYFVVIISVLTIILNVLLQSILHSTERKEVVIRTKENLTLLEKIMSINGYKQIIDVEQVNKIEKTAEEIIVFTEDLSTDYQKDDNTIEKINQGLLANSVANNLQSKKQYIYKYFLKNNKSNRQAIGEYEKFMKKKVGSSQFLQEVFFCLVSPEDYCFYSELYLYKNENHKDAAVEWIPSLGEIDNPNKQYYVKLDMNQVRFINEIVVNLETKYQLFSLQEILKQKNYC